MENDLLRYAASKGIIDMSYVEDKAKMARKQEYLSKHPYAIWKGSNGKWYTYLPDKQKGRILIKKATQDEVEKAIVDYWKGEEFNPTVEEIFTEWNDHRVRLGKISPATHLRNKNTFNYHFSTMGKQRIKTLNAYDIEEFLEAEVYNKHLTAKAFANLKSTTRGFLKYAKKKRLIDFPVEELFDDLDISSVEFRQVIKEDYEEVFDEEEMDKMIAYLEDNLDIQNMAILLLFITGMRIGELVTLKHSDFDTNTIKIRRTETTYKDENGKRVHAVKEFPKSRAGVRTIVVPNDYTWLVDKINSENSSNEYVFCRNGKRLHTDSIQCRLRRNCKKLGIYRKSPNKIRKTYGTILLDNNIDKRLVIELMGHSDAAVTERHYHRNRRTIDNKIRRISMIPEFAAK